MSYIEIRQLKKSFRKHVVLDGLDFDIEEGNVIVLLGPSGSGKTTFLRCLNFLEQPESGTIKLDQMQVDSARLTKKVRVAYQKQTAMVFQHYALFRNQNALENIALPLMAAQGYTKEEAFNRAAELLDQVGLRERAQFYPSALSGGQQQRIGIARALALAPKLMLFDEPTSALDPELVQQVLLVLKEIAKQKQTMVIVTHEMRFAYEVADHIVFMEHGKIVEQGPPKHFFHHPKQERTQAFIAKFREQLPLDEMEEAI